MLCDAIIQRPHLLELFSSFIIIILYHSLEKCCFQAPTQTACHISKPVTAAAAYLIADTYKSLTQHYHPTCCAAARYGQYQWGGFDCKEFQEAAGNHPAGWATNTHCALNWTKPVATTNLAFLVVAPAVAALAAVVVIGLRNQRQRGGCSRRQAAVALLQSWGSTQLPPT